MRYAGQVRNSTNQDVARREARIAACIRREKMSTAGLESISAPPSASVHEPLHLGYRPALDGLRAFAVLVVMAHHGYVPFFGGGAVGVDLFFVLSGFLITSLLLEEWRKTRNISLAKFYLRRILRLIPALVVFLLFIQLYVLVFLRGHRFWEMEKAIAAVIFYVANWMRAFKLVDMDVLAHTWSLSIEEQFYLVWPVALLLLLRTRIHQSWILRLLGLAILLVALRRASMWMHMASADRIYNGSDTRSDELLTGCALAVWLQVGAFSRERVRSIVRYLFPLAALVIVASIARPLADGAMYTFGWPSIELSVAVVILALLSGSAGPVQKVLELPVAVWIGRLSYGLYLWHVPIIGRAGGWHFLGPLRVPVGFILTFAVAAASYYVVELRFLRRKKQFASA